MGPCPDQFVIDQFMEGTHLKRFLGRKMARLEQHVSRPTGPESKVEQRGDQPGNQPTLRFGQAERGTFGSDDQVAGQHQSGSSCDCRAINGRDQWFGEPQHDFYQLLVLLRIFVPLRLRVLLLVGLLHFLQVHARTKRVSRTD